MTAKRYGVFIPPFGYVYDGAPWETLRFTPDAAKAVLGKSYTRVEAALEYIEAIKRQKNEEFKTVQLAVYKVTATAEVEQAVDAKESLQTSRATQYARQLGEYKALKASYDAMSAKEVDQLSESVWKHYKGLERRLLLLELI